MSTNDFASACPDIANYKAANPSWGWQYSRLYQGAKDYHNLKLISSFGDGHAKAIAAKSVMMGEGTDTYGTCEETHFHARWSRIRRLTTSTRSATMKLA